MKVCKTIIHCGFNLFIWRKFLGSKVFFFFIFFFIRKPIKVGRCQIWRISRVEQQFKPQSRIWAILLTDMWSRVLSLYNNTFFLSNPKLFLFLYANDAIVCNSMLSLLFGLSKNSPSLWLHEHPKKLMPSPCQLIKLPLLSLGLVHQIFFTAWTLAYSDELKFRP